MITKKIKKDVKYRGLGGKRIDIEFEVPNDEVFRKSFEGNWACYNFVERRQDFKHNSPYKCYYGKVDGLGYIIASDELEG